MIDGLKPYPEYQALGSKWIGVIPSHWDLCSLRAITTAKNQRDRPDLPLLSVVREKGVILRSRTGNDDNYNYIPDDLSNYKVVQTGNLVINKMKAWQGSMGIAPCDGVVSPAYFVFEFNMPNKAFGHALLRSKPYVAHFAQMSDGVRVGQWDLSIQRMRSIPVVIPDLSEQAAIVKFLDHATRRLNRAIRAKQKMIALLNEQKQVIIHRAVTRGLDPNVPLKPSGIPWLGDIPAHWKVLRAKYVFREVDERSTTGTEELLSVSHITGVTPRSEKQITMFKASSYVGHKLCRPGDLVINTMWAWMAALGVSKHMGIISPSYAVYRPRNPEQLVGEYIDHLLRVRPFISEYICRSTGIRPSRLRLYPEYFFKIPIVIPPVEEQQEIVLIISSETKDLRNAINHTERQITLLQEFRTRLIADVVTGKLDVREAASRLPVETEEVEPDMEAIDTIEEEFQESETMGEAYG